jgi:hypothetical protein
MEAACRAVFAEVPDFPEGTALAGIIVTGMNRIAAVESLPRAAIAWRSDHSHRNFEPRNVLLRQPGVGRETRRSTG